MRSVHCSCEDAATFKGVGPRYVRGGGAREASDKIFQHNGTIHSLSSNIHYYMQHTNTNFS